MVLCDSCIHQGVKSEDGQPTCRLRATFCIHYVKKEEEKK